MAVICPTVLATDLHDYRKQMEQVEPFATRVQIDLSDGKFSPTKTVDLQHVWWPDNITADLHIMYERPLEHLDTFVHLKPNLVIVHAEASGSFTRFARTMHANGIKAGIALLPTTDPNVILPGLRVIDHVLIFSGSLGQFGGQADLTQLVKVAYLKKMKPQLEFGWDGGVNEKNAVELTNGGIDVLNVGGSIQKASDPATVYALLKGIAEKQAETE